MPGRLVKRATYANEYHELTKKEGAPFVPYAVWKDLFFAAFILLAVAACAVYFGPFGPTEVGRTRRSSSRPCRKPRDYFFLVAVRLAFATCRLPWRRSCSPDRPGSRHRRSDFAAILFGRRGEEELAPAAHCGFDGPADRGNPGKHFTHLAGFTPWSPHMNAWSGDPLPDEISAWHHRASAPGKVRWFSRASSVATAIPSVKVAASEVQHLIVLPCA